MQYVVIKETDKNISMRKYMPYKTKTHTFAAG